MAVISSAPRPRAGLAKTARPRPWVMRLLLVLVLMACDALAVNGAFASAYVWRFDAGDLSDFAPPNAPSVWLFFGLFTNSTVTFCEEHGSAGPSM